MGPVQILILVSMLIMLFVLIIYTYNGTKNTLTDVSFPPVISNCPDYWSENEAGQCVNDFNLGSENCQEPTPLNGEKYQGQIGKCQKYKWAKSCGLSWDGITNDPSICIR